MTFRPTARAAKLRARKWASPSGFRSRSALDRANNRCMAASRSAGLMLRVWARRTRSRARRLVAGFKGSELTPSGYHSGPAFSGAAPFGRAADCTGTYDFDMWLLAEERDRRRKRDAALADETRAAVRTALARHVPGTPVWVYGSFVTGIGKIWAGESFQGHRRETVIRSSLDF